MPDLNHLDSQREQELNKALEALHFAFRSVAAKPDAILAEQGLSRVHHRILYFVGRHPGLSVNELLAMLRVSKQSLNAPLRQLTKLGLIEAQTDPLDRRIKQLALTQAGLDLEKQLSGDQRQRFTKVFDIVGQEGEATWHQIMKLLAEDLSSDQMD
ncbi:helix-turn-helix domain-containing protein [Synechocystis sp. LKSZ1]|uniref:MarR family winged helix-turn-helix transcriptional regulator n=1 Tax=Synechocystis sp. LKSZ1 TaxID=3144951 RepID=UPI00336C2CC7